MYSEKTQNLFLKLIEANVVGASGEITLDFLNIKLKINDKSSIGYLIQEWLAEWMKRNNIYFRENENSQMPPDFYLGKDDIFNLLEIKAFDYSKGPNFDIANFDAYVRDIEDNAFRINADYLIFGYTLVEGVLRIEEIWLKKVWEITCPSNKYSLKTQVKQNKIYNIRPYNFKTNSQGFLPFENRIEFVYALKETLEKYTLSNKDEWFNNIQKNYKEITSEEL